MLKQEEKHWFRISALEEDEVTGEPLWIRKGMRTGLEQIHLTANQKDYGEGEDLWKNYGRFWILDVWGRQESCYDRNGIWSKERELEEEEKIEFFILTWLIRSDWPKEVKTW